MSETLAARVSRIIAGGFHAMLDKLEDQAPEVVMEQSIREVDQVIAEVRQELGVAAANRHLAQQQHGDLNQRHLDLSTNAEHAVAQGRDELARAAVARQLDIEAQLPVLETTLANLVKQEAELTRFVEALLGKKRELQDALSNFRASRARVESSLGIAPAPSSALSRLDEATSAFNRVYERQAGRSAVNGGTNIDQAGKLRELEELVRSNKIEERLAQLKAGAQ